MTEMKPRLIRGDDFVAETLEAMASRIPEGHPDADHCRRMAKLFRESGRTGMIRVWEEAPSVTDYRIEQDGLVVAHLSGKATARGTGPKPKIGARLAFKTRHETAEFVRAAEAEGFTFEGKQFLERVL